LGEINCFQLVANLWGKIGSWDVKVKRQMKREEDCLQLAM